MELVFLNCRLYNGVESYVGEIGINVNREYDNLILAFGFKEKFGGKVTIKKEDELRKEEKKEEGEKDGSRELQIN